MDDNAVMRVLQLLRCRLYTTDSGFQLESQVWARDGDRRDPYRALILFRLSAATDDNRLTPACQQVFDVWPSVGGFLTASPAQDLRFQNIVKNLGLENKNMQFIESARIVISDCGNVVPDNAEVLKSKIKHVGDKIAECVVGYGYGMPAMPVDGNVSRVLFRVTGLRSPYLPHASDWTPHFRLELKRITTMYPEWMKSVKLAMIDIHELLRLHGKSVCTDAPHCQWCPVVDCCYRSTDYEKSVSPAMQAALKVVVTWDKWRQLLLRPQA